MGQVIEGDSPLNQKEGSRRIYHAISRDWITNEIFRRVEADGRTMGEYWREEIQEQHDLDVHINLLENDLERC